MADAAHASAQEQPDANELDTADVVARDALDRTHRESIATRRALGTSVLVAGGVSVVGGAVLMIPNGDDQAWRFAGINTAVFGVVNTVVGLLALHGIAGEESAWQSDEARASRRTSAGLARAAIHAAVDERRESVGHAINLGLDCAYLGVAGTAVVASRVGIDHPKRWLASGAAIAFQSLFLVGIDFIGLTRSGAYHRAFLDAVSPAFSITPSAAGPDVRFGLRASF